MASPKAPPGAVVYNYFWTHQPLESLNMANLSVEGAFHGSEVPFVFGYPPEIKQEVRRNSSARSPHTCLRTHASAHMPPHTCPQHIDAGQAATTTTHATTITQPLPPPDNNNYYPNKRRSKPWRRR